MFMIPGGYRDAPPGTLPSAEAVAEMMQFNAALQEDGVLLALDGLHPPSMGAHVTFADGTPSVGDGPLPGANDVVGGYWIIDVPTKEHALAWATRCPAGRDDAIEIRQIQEFSDFVEEPHVP